MARFFKNRTANEWRALLAAHGYKWIHNNGDDQVWKLVGNGIVILVPDRNEGMILPTSMDMARKMGLGAGTSKKDILKWWKENGFGE